MARRWTVVALISFGLAGAGSAIAQAPPGPAPYLPPPEAGAPGMGAPGAGPGSVPAFCPDDTCGPPPQGPFNGCEVPEEPPCPPCLQVTAEALYWWLRSEPTPPLVTRG